MCSALPQAMVHLLRNEVRVLPRSPAPSNEKNGMARVVNLRVWIALLGTAIAAAMAVALVVGTELAEAAFPGTNGAIAFSSCQLANEQVIQMNPDSFGQTKLSDTAGENYRPDWSADGKKIVFVNSVGGTNSEIYSTAPRRPQYSRSPLSPSFITLSWLWR
jgi:hypothetical protein